MNTNISAGFIKRPVATTLLMLVMVIFGILAYTRLPISDYPNMETPFIIVVARLPGADPETMATSVAKPLEKNFSAISGLKNMSSINKQNMTLVILEFQTDKPIDSAALDVQSNLGRAYSSMPDAMTTQPFFIKMNPDSMPILQLSLTSDTISPRELTDYAENYLAQQLTMIKGVSQANVFGAKRYAVRVELDPDRMLARNVGVDEVKAAISYANPSLPTGVLRGEARIFNITVDGGLKEVDEFANIIVSWRNGAPIRLSDVANVVEGVENKEQGSWLNGTPGITVGVTKQPGGNTVQVVTDVLAMLPDIQDRLPDAIKLEIRSDNSETIKASVEEVQFTLLLTMALVVLVIYCFLHSAMTTLIPSLALPICVFATYAFMFAMDYSLNNVSLLALILVIGLVVDDAIVMLENIVRHREMGKSAMRAAIEGSGEVVFTILSMTVSLMAVFVPMLFMTGMLAAFFGEFAGTIMLALGASFLISVTLTPMMAARFLPDSIVHKKLGGFNKLFDRGFRLLTMGYRLSLRWCMRHKFSIFVLSLAMIGGIYAVAKVLPTGFFPALDGGNISITTRAEESISYRALSEAHKEFFPILDADPAISNYTVTIGGGFMNSSNTGSMRIKLKPRKERDHIDVVMERLRESLSHNPTLNVFVANGDSQSARQGGTGEITYQLTGADLDELYVVADKLKDIFQTLPELRNVMTDLQLQNPLVRLTVDRDKATALGVNVTQIESLLYSAFGTQQVSTIYSAVSDYEVIIEVMPDKALTKDVLSALYIRSANGGLIPLDTLVTMEEKVGPLQIKHYGTFPCVSLSFDPAAGYSLGQAANAALDAAEDHLPDGVSGKLTGTAETMQSSIRDLIMLIIVAIVLIYIILGILYESFIHPITILSGLPSAVFGGMLALWIFHSEINIVSLIGMLMLVGIVKKNGIMVVDFTLAAERQGLSREAAVIEGCVVRFRPILMTTIAAVMGSLPLALGLGDVGADLRRPIGICISGGLIFSQIVTLYITPVYFVYFDRLGSFIKRISKKVFGRVITQEDIDAVMDAQGTKS